MFEIKQLLMGNGNRPANMYMQSIETLKTLNAFYGVF